MSEKTNLNLVVDFCNSERCGLLVQYFPIDALWFCRVDFSVSEYTLHSSDTLERAAAHVLTDIQEWKKKQL